jgi:hypothetical protein
VPLIVHSAPSYWSGDGNTFLKITWQDHRSLNSLVRISWPSTRVRLIVILKTRHCFFSLFTKKASDAVRNCHEAWTWQRNLSHIYTRTGKHSLLQSFVFVFPFPSFYFCNLILWLKSSSFIWFFPSLHLCNGISRRRWCARANRLG